MNRRQFLTSVAATAAAAGLSRMSKALGADERIPEKRPANVLFIYTDEQRFDTLACYGNNRLAMPNINALAERSTVFERCYDTQPVCTPARGSIVTGLYPQAHGAFDNNVRLRPEVKCLPEYLPKEYVCGHFGKWHLGDEIFPQHGFTDWRGTEDTYHATYSPPVQEFGPERSAYHHWLVAHGVTPKPPAFKPDEPGYHPAQENRFFRDQIIGLPEELSRPAFLADQAIDFMQANQAKPWVLFVNFLEPHPPYGSCRDAQYKPEDVTLAPNWQETLGPDRPLSQRLRLGATSPTEAQVREMTAKYWGMCSLVDTQVGRMLQTLADLQLTDDTLIVFTSDHGDMLGSYGLTGKSCMLDEAARIPLLISRPGQREQQRVGCPVSQVDLVPTLLDLMGQPVPAGLHGASLRPALDGGTTGRDVFIQWGTGPMPDPATQKPVKLKPHQEKLCSPEQAQAAASERIRTIVTRDNWKLNQSSIGDHELYDLNADPLERHNLVSDPAQAGRIAELRERITVWQRRIGDVG